MPQIIHFERLLFCSRGILYRGWAQSIGFSVSVCNFYTAKLLFRRNNKVWCNGLGCKGSSVTSYQTRWYNKRILGKGYSVPRDFSWIENYKPIQRHQKFFKYLLLQKTCVHRRSSSLYSDWIGSRGKGGWITFFW